MKKAWHQGLIVTFAAATLVSCTQESVMGESTPQVTNTSISLTFFEQSMSDIGGRTRANSGTALQACMLLANCKWPSYRWTKKLVQAISSAKIA